MGYRTRGSLNSREEAFTKASVRYSADWTTTFDIEVFNDKEGNPKKYNVRLFDVVTVYDSSVEIAKLFVDIVGYVAFTGEETTLGGTIVGYGNEDLESVHISAVDLGVVGVNPGFFQFVVC